MICTVYQVGNNPDHLLLVCVLQHQDGQLEYEVVNGAYSLVKTADGSLAIPAHGDQACIPVLFVGEIDDAEHPDPGDGHWDEWRELLTDFQEGKRAVFIECKHCGHGKWGNVDTKVVRSIQQGSDSRD